MTTNFEEEVLTRLTTIEERLSGIESKFDEATSFADSVLSDENNMFGKDGLNSIKHTLSTLLNPPMSGKNVVNTESDPDSLQDLVGSLKDFRERLHGIKAAIADLPDEPQESEDEEGQESI